MTRVYPAPALLLPAALLLFALPAHAGGWTQPAGQYYAKISSSTIVGSDLLGSNAFDTDGEVVELPESFLVTSLNVYAEYGILETLTAVVYGTPYGHASYGDESTDYVGLVAGGFRHGAALGDARLAVELHYGYSAGDDTSIGAGEAEGTPFVFVPALKYQQIDGELQLGYPLSFGWAAASAGYRHFIQEDDALDPALYGFAQLGYSGDGYTLDFHLNFHHALGDVEITNVPGKGQTRYLGFGFGGTWWFTDSFGANAGFEGAAYAYSNAATPTLLLGVELKN